MHAVFQGTISDIKIFWNRITKSELLHLSVAFALAFLCSFLTSSIWFDRLIGIPHLEIVNYTASPIEWLALVLLMCAYLKPPRTTPPAILEERIRWFEYCSLLLYIATVVFALWLTHPSDAIYQYIVNFIAENKLLGGPIVAAVVAVAIVTPFFPAYAFIAPLTALSKGWELLVIYITLIGCFFISVIEAVYFTLLAPFIMQLLTKILLLFSWNVYVNIEHTLISIDGFRVVIGAACAGFGYMLLFLLFFTYLVFYLGTVKKVSSMRALLALVLGLTAVFFLNILRIVTLMLVGIEYPEFALTLFHSVIGSVYFFLFFLLAFPFIRKFITRRK
ncbi:hypothetical protein EXS65_01505 [Candidatus Peribacteria bacterium]|nr:hypothetical protein [Candidatus Peribacteria bacterium]